MGKDSGTKCSLCGMNGHNSRTCATEKTVEFKLFGVKISEVITTSSDKKQREDLIKKSVSMGNLQAHRHGGDDDDDDDGDMDRGYLSDSHVRSKKDGHERKKGVPWTMEEHRTFLKGLEKLGKGDWRGISKNFVTTRSPTQVASHAQKYFLRKAAANKKKRRASLFDMSFKEEGETSESDPMETDKFPKQVARLQTTGPSVQIPNPVASHGTPTPPALSSMPMSRAQSIPNFSGIPYMVGAPGAHMSYMKSEGYSVVPVVPVMNMCNVGYPYQPKHQNSFTACTPFAPHQLYNNPFSASAVPYYFPRVEPHSSSQVNTDLKLNNTAAPDVGDRAKLPTHTSNMNGAIGVI